MRLRECLGIGLDVMEDVETSSNDDENDDDESDDGHDSDDVKQEKQVLG